jgi:D-glycero-D-manno-heptose 1,7-bisphosphate phosphatase
VKHQFALPRSQRTANHTIFLDRDGVINQKAPEGDYVKSWSEFVFLPGVLQALALFATFHVRVVVLTNQRGIALNRYSLADLATIHDNMTSAVEAASGRIDAIYFCPHDVGVCDCRKPAPGLLNEAFADFPDITPSQTPFIGDSRSDLAAARTARVPAWHLTNKPRDNHSDEAFPSLFAAAQHFTQACST